MVCHRLRRDENPGSDSTDKSSIRIFTDQRLLRHLKRSKKDDLQIADVDTLQFK
jgi:hypothetical protein